MAMRQKFSKSTVRYTVNGKATFNPMFVSFKLLLAGDVELNPGDAAEEITQLKQVLKQISPVFAEPLTRLFNISITKGLFPNKWKVARVSPLFKDGARDNRSNYRPISILPVFSKLLEKHVAGSFMDYLVINGLLYDLQSAFRVEHSTESALIKLTDQILFDLDQDIITGMVSVDFKKHLTL